MNNLSVEKTNKDANVDKAAKLAAAVAQNFKQHQVNLGSKTLTSIAWSFAAA